MHALRLSLFAPLAVGLAVAHAQEPSQPTSQPSLEQLAQNVDIAHHPDGPVAAIDAFCCSLELRLTARDAENAGAVELDVMFQLLRQEGRKKPLPLIRYTVRSGEQPIERGRDRDGPWQLQRGEAVDLNSPQLVNDLEQCDRHTNLARQLLRFLSPGDVLREMTAATVSRTEFRMDRAKRVPCWTIQGRSARFPLLQSAGEDTPVRLEVHVDVASHRLVAVDAWPLVDDQPVADKGERILLEEMHARDGVLVPHRLVHLFLDARGVPRPQTVASFTLLQLRPKLDEEDFDRKRRR